MNDLGAAGRSGSDNPEASGRPGPYIGPRSFRWADADRFFGRRLEARDVLSLWLADKVTVLHGPAAAGKTSLLQAGILPLLSRQGGADVLPVGSLVHQAARPTAAQSEHNGYTLAVLGGWAQLSEPVEPGTSIAEFLLARSPRISPAGEPYSILGVIDQFEGLFTAFPARHDERQAFIDELRIALDQVPALKLLLIVTDDQLAVLSSYERQLVPYPFNYIRLDALRPENAIDAIRGPIANTRMTFAPGVAEELVDRLRTVLYQDLAGESATIKNELVEPLLLQIVCSALWSSLPSDVQLVTIDDLQSFGDISQALSHFYDTIIDEVELETGYSQERLRDWIESTFITEHGTRGSASRGSVETAGLPNAVVDALEQRLVLTIAYRAQSIWYQLSQDRMIIPVREANRAWRSQHGIDAISEPTPATPTALRTAAEVARAEGNFGSAHRFVQRVVDAYRNSSDYRHLAYALVLKGDIALSEGDLASAEESFQEALSTFSAIDDSNLTARILSALANVYFAVGDFGTAAELHRQAIGMRPTDVQALIGLGYALWYGGSPADAEITFAQALTWNAESAAALGGRGQVRAELREYADALVDLDAALGLGLAPSEQVDAHSARALALAGLGRDEDARAALADARILAPDRPRTLRRMARIAALRDDRELALSEAERALAATPPLPPWDERDARRLVNNLRAASDHNRI